MSVWSFPFHETRRGREVEKGDRGDERREGEEGEREREREGSILYYYYSRGRKETGVGERRGKKQQPWVNLVNPLSSIGAMIVFKK